MNWEKIISLLTSPDAVFFLIFLIVLILLLAFLSKKGILVLDIKGVKLGYTERERTIIRQQSEWANLYCEGIEPKLPHPEGYDKYKSLWILDQAYKEIVTWITYNHITMNESYVEIKQNKLVFLINSLTTNEAFHTEEFNDFICKETKYIISKLVQIRELYTK